MPPRGCLATKAISEVGSGDEKVADRIQRYQDSLRGALTATITRAVTVDGLPPADVDLFVETIAASVLAHNLLIGSGASSGSTTAPLDAARAMIARAAVVR